MRVLIVDQDSVVRRDLVDQLEQRSFTVTTSLTVAAALVALREATFDAAIVSVELEDGSGLEVVREIRQEKAPIHVIAMSTSGRESSRVDALDRGADDYVVKPFFVRELAARLGAVRRHETRAGDRLLIYGPLAIDLVSRTATFEQTALSLTPLEFGLLAFLAARPGHVFSRRELLVAVWKSSADWQRESTVTEHVRTLRLKIESVPDQPRLVQTVRGIGYRFDPPSVEQASSAVTGPAIVTSPRTGAFTVIDDKIVSADESAVTMFGAKDAGDLLGRSASEFLVAPFIPNARAIELTRPPSAPPLSSVVAIRAANGPNTYVELSSFTALRGNQRVIDYSMTSRIDQSVALRHIITGVAGEVSDAVIVTDPNFHILSWNDAAERLYGWAEHEVIGRRIEDVLRFVGSDTTLAAAKQTLSDKGRWFGELSLLAHDGSAVDVWTSHATIRDEAGQPALVAGVHRPVITPRRTETAARKVALDEDAIRQGLESGEFVSHYEPIVALEPRHVVAIAGCPRWDHPELGLVTPAELMDLGEHVDAFVEVERMAFACACEQADAWRRAGLELNLTLQLSNPQLADVTLFEDVSAMLAKSGLDPRALWLEVTETALVEDVELAADLLHRFESLGVRVSVDNFGIGWASLTYLQQLPVHTLKIDEHFVAGILDDHRSAAIIRSVVALGRDLGLAVVAVGVQTEAQDAALRALGCRYGQGQLYGAPVSGAELSLETARRV